VVEVRIEDNESVLLRNGSNKHKNIPLEDLLEA
jgi:hypothetical protein